MLSIGLIIVGFSLSLLDSSSRSGFDRELLYKALAENARQQKVTRTALVRLAVEQYLALNEKPQAA